jgi:hypothetical protein
VQSDKKVAPTSLQATVLAAGPSASASTRTAPKSSRTPSRSRDRFNETPFSAGKVFGPIYIQKQVVIIYPSIVDHNMRFLGILKP